MDVKTLARAVTPMPLWRTAAYLKQRANARFGKRSYAASGEDLLIAGWLRHHRHQLADACYVDVGAADPIELSNTYLLYRAGARGLLIEPDPDQCIKLRARRPRDIVVNAGAAFDERRSARLYRLTSRVFNTFSQESAESTVAISRTWDPRDRQDIVDTVEIPLIPLSDIIRTHLPGRYVHVLSIDTEGVEVPILRSFDLDLADPDPHVPMIVCVERGEPLENSFSILRPRGFEFMAGTPSNWLFQK